VIVAVETPRPLPHQLAVLTSSARFKCVCCGRRWGKTALGLRIVLRGHGPFRGALRGAKIWWATRDYPTSNKIWRDLKHAVRGWSMIAVSEAERRISFPGGGSVTVRSAHNPDSLRGEGLDGLVFDECAFCEEEAWKVLRPALADRRGWCVFITTPNGQNWFADLFYKQAEKPGWERWQRPTSENPTIHREEIEAARADLGEHGFRREWQAEFLGKSESMFRREWFERSTYRVRDGRFFVEGQAQNVQSCFATGDLAWTKHDWSDYTVLVAWGVTEKHLLVLDLVRERWSAPELAPRMQAFVRKWGARAIVLERAGPIQHLNREAREAGLPVMEYPVYLQDKVMRAEPFAAGVERGRVRFPPIDGPEKPEWVDQALAEILIFKAPDPKTHDDVVDALALGPLVCPVGMTPPGAILRDEPPTPLTEDDFSGGGPRRATDTDEGGDWWLRPRRGWL